MDILKVGFLIELYLLGILLGIHSVTRHLLALVCVRVCAFLCHSKYTVTPSLAVVVVFHQCFYCIADYLAVSLHYRRFSNIFMRCNEWRQTRLVGSIFNVIENFEGSNKLVP